MIRRIVLENFMSHKRTVIEPADGLTVLTGPNNCGKSAVVVALQTLCTNEPSQAFVRHGEKEARVAIETDDGHKVEWSRQGSTVSYKIDGREIHRLNRKVPEDLHEILKLPMVQESDGPAFDIHFAEQKHPIFLLDQPGSRAAQFFASSSDAALLMRMQQRHRQLTSERKGEERILAREVDRAERQLEALESLPELHERTLQAERAYELLRDDLSRAANLRNLAGELNQAFQSIEKQEETTETLQALQVPPELQDTEELESTCRRIAFIGSVRLREHARSVSLSALAEPPVLGETAPLRALRANLAITERTRATQHELARCLQPLQAPPEMHRLEEIATDLRLLRSLAATAAALERTKTLASPPEPPELENAMELASVIHTIKRAETECGRREGELKEIEIALRTLKEEAQHFVQDHPICPTCGGKIDPEHVLDPVGGHAHV